MPSVRTMAGLAKGLQGIGTPTSRAEARARKAQSDEMLQKHNLRQESGAVEDEVKLVKEQTKQALNEVAKMKTFQAFRAYNSDLNPKHLNNALEDPTIKNLFPNVARVEKVDPKNDMDIINKTGLPEGLFEDPELGPNALSRFVKVINSDGTAQISDIVQLQASTGYTKYMDDEELKVLKERSIIAKNFKTGAGEDTSNAKDAKKWGEVLSKDVSKWSQEDHAFNKLMIDKTQGNLAGQLGAAQEAQSNLLKEVGGDEGWQKLDLSDRKTRLKVEPYIQQIEKMGGLDLDTHDKKMIKDVRKLLSLGEGATELTPEVTGLMDNLFFRMQKYVPGNVTEADIVAMQASSAYVAFQNELRSQLYGSVLTPGENEKFDNAYGSLKQQFPEVMAQLGTMLKGLQTDIDTVLNFNNPYVVEFRLGDTVDRAERMSDNIDRILRRITAPSKEVIQPAPNNPDSNPAPAGKKTLKQIFRGGQ